MHQFFAINLPDFLGVGSRYGSQSLLGWVQQLYSLFELSAGFPELSSYPLKQPLRIRLGMLECLCQVLEDIAQRILHFQERHYRLFEYVDIVESLLDLGQVLDRLAQVDFGVLNVEGELF